MIDAMVESAVRSAALAEATGLAHDRIILSAKVSAVQDLVEVYRRLARARRLPAAPRPDRGGHGHEGHRAPARPALAHPAAGRHRRHHPRLADAGARRRPHRRGAGRAADPAVARPPQLHAAGHRLSRMRPHHQHLLPGDGPGHPGLPPRPDAGVARALAGRRGAARRGHGVRRQRPGASRSTPTSASRCRARSRSPWRRCSSTAHS